MTRNTRRTTTTALAIAIAAAIVAAPIAYSAGKKPAASVKRGTPIDVQQMPGQDAFDSFIISYHKGTKASATVHRQSLQNASRALGIRITPQRDLATGARLIALDRKLDKAASKQLMIELMKDPTVRAVEPNGRMYRAFEPNDPRYAEQWHYQDGPGGVNLEPAWDDATGDGIVVAVLDTGSTPHVDLAGQYVDGYDFITAPAEARDGDGRDDDPNDEGDWTTGSEGCGGASDSSWHGTHVSGTVAAATDNNVGVAGVAFDAKVQPVRVLGRCGGTFVDVAEAIIWASGGTVAGVPANATPAEVINLSLGGGGACSTLVQDAVDTAIGNGSTVVVSAGNSGADTAGFTPANCDGVIAVAATNPDGELSGFSNFGATVSVAAPGGSGFLPFEDQVLSTLNAGTTVQTTDTYEWYLGTSMAAPHVAGVAALVQSVADTPYSPADLKRLLENTAYAANGFVPGCGTFSLQCGAGIIDATLAVAVATGEEPLPPDPPEPPPPPVTELENDVPVTIDLEEDEQQYFVLEVPEDATNVTFTTTGSDPDADLYVRFGELPTLSTYACRGFTGSSNETCSINNPAAGEWFVSVHGYTQALDVTLTGVHDGTGEPGEAPTDLAHSYVFPLRGHRLRVPLSWEGGEDEVDIVFDGDVAVTVDNTGRFTHTFTRQGTGTVTYQVCNAGTSECSAEIDVDYRSRP